MSLTGTDNQRGSRPRVGKTRRRAIVALGAAAALAAIPLSVEAAGGVLTRGDQFTPGKTTPVEVKAALRANGPVVLAFLLPGITEDEIVQKRLDRIRKESAYRDTKFIVYRITGATKLGDLTDQLGIRYTPAVAVIQGDDKLSNIWRGLVDEDIIAQSIIDARRAVPRPLPLPTRTGPPSGNPAGIALARSVNAAYRTVPGIGVDISGTVSGVPEATATVQGRLLKGVQRAYAGQVTGPGGSAEVIVNATGIYSKSVGAACWTRQTTGWKTSGFGDRMIPVAGVEFSRPVRSKDGATLTLSGKDLTKQYGGGRSIYVIDAKSKLLVSVRQRGATSTVTSLDAAPAAPKPDKIC